MFTWSLRDILGIDLEVDQHYLNVSPEAKPVKQRPCRFTPECQHVISDEVDRLLGAGFITKF